MRRICFIGALAIACGPRVPFGADVDDGDAGDTSSGPSSAETTSTSLPTPGSDATSSSSTSVADTTTTTTTTSGADGCPFVCPSDLGDAIEDCDIWAQDCPAGQKCMPWADDGGNAWNAARCSPIADDPAQLGEPCTVEDSGVSGIDDCDQGSMCWVTDYEADAGTCVAFCIGSFDDPVCVDTNLHCVFGNDGFPIICLANCDPLLQDCNDGEACYPIGDGFACAPSVPREFGVYGDPCEFINACAPSLFCDEVIDDVPGCEGSFGCCNVFCDLAANDPDVMCPDTAQGQFCAPWFAQGQTPPGFADVGRCRMP